MSVSACVEGRGDQGAADGVEAKGRLEDWMREMSSASRAA